MDEEKEYSIEDIEQKMKASRKAYVDYTCMLGDRSLKGVMPNKDEMKEQKFLKSQYDAFNKIFRDMSKDSPSIKKGVEQFISQLEKYASSVAPIKVKSSE
jgi:hypothetical protein